MIENFEGMGTGASPHCILQKLLIAEVLKGGFATAENDTIYHIYHAGLLSFCSFYNLFLKIGWRSETIPIVSLRQFLERTVAFWPSTVLGRCLVLILATFPRWGGKCQTPDWGSRKLLFCGNI